MASDFKDYLQSLGMGKVLVDRVDRVTAFYELVLPEKIDDIFINDYVNEDSTRTYGSMWIFTATFMGEARDWQTSDDWDVLRVAAVKYWRLQKQNFEFGSSPSEASRFTLEFATLTNAGTLTAARENCGQLWTILSKYINHEMSER